MSVDKTTRYGWDRPNALATPPVNVREEFLRLGLTLEQIDGLIYSLGLALAGKAAANHSHLISEVSGLVDALAAKMPANATFKLDDLSDVDGATGASSGQILVKTPSGWVPALPLAVLGAHGHTIAGVEGLQTALDAKLDDTQLDTDSALAANSDGKIPSQKAIRTALGLKQNIADRGMLAGFRNKLINGDFDIWQRFTTTGSWVAPLLNYYTADRWVAQSNGTGGNGAVSRQAFAAGQTDVPGNPEFFLRWQITAAAAGQSVGSCYFEQRIENVRTLAGRKATLTIYLKGTGTLPSINLIQVFGSGGSPLVNTALASNVVLQAGWTKLQYVVDVPAITGKTIGANSYLAVNINVPVNAAYTLDVAHASLVEGDATLEADPFASRNPQQELALCQRYYNKTYDLWTAPGTATFVGVLAGLSSGTNVDVNWSLPVPMRASPTVVGYSPQTGAVGTWSPNATTPTVGLLSAGTRVIAVRGIGAADQNGHSIHLTADAEL